MKRRRPALVVVGTGRLARALVPMLGARGNADLRLVSRTPASARRLAARVPGAVAATDVASAIRGARIVLIAVPDRAINDVARMLRRAVPTGWKGRVVLHTAGAFGPEPLRVLARAGAATGVFHPLQVLGTPEMAVRVVPGSAARIEGAAAAVSAARRLCRDLGLLPLPLRGRLRHSDRAAYHAAASLASNDVVALLSLAAAAMESAGASHRTALASLTRLAEGALVQLAAGGIEGALTGPVARGDAATLAAQIGVLSRRSPSAGRVHRELSLALLRIAVRSGRLSRAEGEAVRRVLAGSGLRRTV